MDYHGWLKSLPIVTRSTREGLCGPNVTVNGVIPCKGWKPRDYAAQPVGSLGFCSVSPEPRIPRSEYKERILDRIKSGASLGQIARKKKVGPYNQSNTNYCWTNAVLKGCEILRVAAGQKHVPLSPASVAAIIKNFNNVGGWGTQAAEFIKTRGAVPQSLWPANAIDRRYNTAAANAERAKYRLDEVFDMQPNDFGLQASHLFRNRLCPFGLPWWGHEVLGVEMVLLEGTDRYGTLILNSWDISWGNEGWAILDEEHATAADVLAMGTMVGS